MNDQGLNQENLEEVTPQPEEVTEPTTTSEASNTLQDEKDALEDKYRRLYAEFDNFRKRNAKERAELIQTASKDLMSSLLTILDDCDRAQKTIQESSDTQAIKEGIELIFNKLRNTLTQKGLKEMEVVSGNDFDAEYHEGITEIPAPTPEMEGKVVDVIEKGYYLNDKIIRYAKVIVGK
jgi:molecular chaperone GrpE